MKKFFLMATLALSVVFVCENREKVALENNSDFPPRANVTVISKVKVERLANIIPIRIPIPPIKQTIA